MTRPDPGLARGAWEAPAWAFWVILVFVVVGASTYLLYRIGVLKLRKRAAEAAPPSPRMRLP